MKTNISIFGIVLGVIYLCIGGYLYSIAGTFGIEIISWFLIMDGICTIVLGIMILIADSVEGEFDQIDN